MAVTASNVDALTSVAYCDLFYGCFGATPQLTTTICSGLTDLLKLSDLPLAVDAGRVVFNADQAKACLAAFADGGCAQLLLQSPCATLATGQIGAGGVCYSSADCKSGACTGNTPSTCSAGTCLGTVEVGAACACSGCGTCDSAGGLVCTSNGSSSTCTSPASQGQPCGSTPDAACAAGLACIGGSCASLPVGPGGPCDVGKGECQFGSYCFKTSAATVGTCATQVALGRPCGEDSDHALGIGSLSDPECANGPAAVVCAGAATLLDGGFVGGTCTKYAAAGGSCVAPSAAVDTTKTFTTGCYVGLNCVAGTCVVPPTSGACSPLTYPCDLNTSFCDMSTNTCQPFVAPGGTCHGSTNECGLPGSCTVNHICKQSSDKACSPEL